MVLVLAGTTAAATGCNRGGIAADSESEASWSALMADGDTSAIVPGPIGPASGAPQPPRFCDDCSRAPLALWTFDDCNPLSTELGDTAFTTSLSHPAFRAVSVACVAGIDGQAVRLARKDDIVYAPDQPDFLFDQGLTVAAFINPDSLNGTQSIVRKRFAGQSAFTLAIDGHELDRKLVFVLHLTSGRNVAVTAPIQARRFTHVAATYDGHDARLYTDGLLAAQTHAPGKIAPGAGPILIGNDADGRQLKGTIDTVWLNTLAAPADAILGLTCIRKAPIVSLSPSVTPPQIAGTPVAFDLAITNASSPTCPTDPFPFFVSALDPQLIPDSFSGAVLAAPGETAHGLFNVKSSRMASVGSYSFEMFVFDVRAQQFTATASATYVVGTGPIACDGAPAATNLIIGAAFSPANGPPFTYVGTGLNAPVVVPVNDTNGFTQALQVSLNPGVATDPANAFLGFGFGFGGPPCLDASAYTGVRFTITGDLGTCGLSFALTPSQDNSVAFGPFGTCTLDNCLPPSTGPIGTGTTTVHFTDLTGGNPLPNLDPTALNAISWNVTPPTDGVTAPCVATFTVSNIAFFSDGPPAFTETFDANIDSWMFSDFSDGFSQNLALTPPAGGAPPTLSWTGDDGDPAPGALRIGVGFTALDQFVDARVHIPGRGVNLAGKTLHARVRLVSGTLPQGVIQFHFSTVQSFPGEGFSSVDAGILASGAWVPVDLDVGAVGAGGNGDPSQVNDIGLRFYSGFSSAGQISGQIFQPTGDVILDVDTVTDAP